VCSLVVMPKSVLSSIKKIAVFCFFTLAGIINYGFVPTVDEQEILAWSNRCFTQSYDASEEKLKKYEFTLTNDAFVRLRKTFTNGKQEYFSFHLKRLNDMAYLGTPATGILQFKTTDEDIIVQTYNDRKGDVDSMATVLNVPVKNMSAERLDSLRTALDYFKAKSL
jgi:hypothetical protein